ncbi:DUF6226 family protein [Nocardioides sp. URHA0020]|uniref:DUF6226 family protein n=1 Tax=Nocardioides sp. URHA0020 TaxID=1380392 RepID=UPI00048EFDD8|nr:DUF6226 family protein [Nocardioides sp. URHA0020]
MAARWGPDGPPEEAYSRVTRDLAQVTAGFAAYLDELPGRLTAEFACRSRPLTDAERDRLTLVAGGPGEAGYAVEPADPGCATLLVARSVHDGGTALTIGFGRAAVASMPSCFCDACDEESVGLIEQAQDYVDVVTGGSREFRRRHRPRHPGEALHEGPWLEQGYLGERGGAASAGPDVRGPLFELDWRAWPLRS